MNFLDRILDQKKIAIALLCVGVFLAYLPVVNGYYLHTDDYFWSYWGGFKCSGVIDWILPIGRPLAGLVYCAFPLVQDFENLNWLRAFSVLNLCFFSYLFYLWCLRWKLTRTAAFFFSLLTVSLPAFQVFAGYLSTVPHGLSVTTSLLALFLAHKADSEPRKRNRNLVYSAGLFVASLCLNQAGALFYCAGMAVPFLTTSGDGFIEFWKKRIWNYVKPIFGGMGFYYLVFRVSAAVFSFRNVGKYDGRNFVGNPRERYTWFVKGPLFETSNLWSVEPVVWIQNLVVLALLLWAILEISRSRKKLSALVKVVLVGLLFPVSFAISLVSASPSPEYRTYAALGSVPLSILFLGGYRWLSKKVFTAVVLLFSVIAIFTANRNVYRYFVYPDSTEFRTVKGEIRYYLATHESLKHIHLILQRGPVATLSERHEMGEPTVRHTPNVPALVLAALSELGTLPAPIITTAASIQDKVGAEIIFDFDKVDLSGKTHVIVPGSTLIIDLSHFNLY